MATDTADTATRKIRLADRPPVRCSSCMGQYPERRHVDFGAAWDGPVLDEPDGVIGGARQVIDDLVICDECMLAAAAELGLEDPGDTRRHVEQVEQEADEVRERLHGAMDYIAKLEQAAAARGQLETLLTGGGD